LAAATGSHKKIARCRCGFMWRREAFGHKVHLQAVVIAACVELPAPGLINCLDNDAFIINIASVTIDFVRFSGVHPATVFQ
jgi:hypothetical protein